MIISRLRLKNWRNFIEVDIPLRERMFVVGANASGKSNLLDVFRFLREISKSEGGGLQKAIADRGGVSKIRCLAARRDPEVSIDIELSESAEDETPKWRYLIAFRQEPRGGRRAYLTQERVWQGSNEILARPHGEDNTDRIRLGQTYLEQVNSNAPFREIADHLKSVTYLHLVPQLLRHADAFQSRMIEDDPFGQGFLQRIAETPVNTRDARLRKIESALNAVVPTLKNLKFDEDKGRPHLAARYVHWRPDAGWQREDQFSDGTLRLIALFWSLLDSDALLLLEEPELSLNDAIVSQLAPMIWKMQRHRKKGPRQVILSSHSSELIGDPGIDGHEVILLSPEPETTKVEVAASVRLIRDMLDAGLTVADAVKPRTRPTSASQLNLPDMFE